MSCELINVLDVCAVNHKVNKYFKICIKENT